MAVILTDPERRLPGLLLHRHRRDSLLEEPSVCHPQSKLLLQLFFLLQVVLSRHYMRYFHHSDVKQQNNE